MRKEFIKFLIELHKDAQNLNKALFYSGIAHASIDLAEGERNLEIFIELIRANNGMDKVIENLNNAIVKSISIYEQETGEQFTLKQ